MQGAAEWVLEKCSHSLGSDGTVVLMTPEHKLQLLEIVSQMANRGLRTLCLSHTDFPCSGNPEDFFETPYDENLVASCIVGIKVSSVSRWCNLIICDDACWRVKICLASNN